MSSHQLVVAGVTQFKVIRCTIRESAQVYDARVRSETRETLALISCGYFRGFCKIALYSTRDRSYYLLPPLIPALRNGGIPCYSQCVSLDGQGYILGGRKDLDDFHSSNVYVSDLAGQRLWKRCASMTVRRSGLKCGVTNGKIYVFGKTEGSEHSYGGEVYDPKENTWSTIKAMIVKGYDHQVHKIEALGQDLFLYGYAASNDLDSNTMTEFPEFLVYHPVKDV